MTELEKRKKALDLARQKYPDVVDAAQLEKLARSMEKKKNIFRSLAMIMGGAVSVLFSLFISSESLTQIFMIMGGVFVSDGLFLLFSLFKKKVEMHIDDSEKVVIDLAYLKFKDKKDNISTIVKQVIFMGAVVALVYGRSDLTVFLLFTLCPLVFIGIYWVFRIRKCRIKQKCILEEQFKIVRTKLYDKEDETDVGTDAETTHTYYLMFEHQDPCDYLPKMCVSRREFSKRELGDACYLLLLRNKKKDQYEIENVFWMNETVLADELNRFLTTDAEMAYAEQTGNA